MISLALHCASTPRGKLGVRQCLSFLRVRTKSQTKMQKNTYLFPKIEKTRIQKGKKHKCKKQRVQFKNRIPKGKNREDQKSESSTIPGKTRFKHGRIFT